MGRLRDGRENNLFQHYSEEISLLYGNDEFVLYRFDESASEINNDPLWDEYSPSAQYKMFKLSGFMSEPLQEDHVESPSGETTDFDMVFKVSRNIMDLRGVPIDLSGEQIRSKDIVLAFSKGDKVYYEVIKTLKHGFVNNTDQWTTLECQLKARSKYTPDRKLP